MNETTPSDIIEDLSMVVPEDPWGWLKLGGAALLALLAAGALLYYLYRRRKLPFQQPPPPEKTALERLAAIRPLVESGPARRFVREASGILRAYIEARFGLRAPRLSTEEFLYEAERSPHLTPDSRARLADFLFGCDRVKFALGDLDRAQMEALYGTAENFVRETMEPAAAGPVAP